MTIKRLILVGLTVIAIALLGLSLYNSLSQPQFQSRLELYQTNLLLHATEWQDENLESARETLLGAKPVESALEQYKKARESTQDNLDKAREQVQQLESAEPAPENALSPAQKLQLQQSIQQLERSNAEIQLRLGIVQAKLDQTDAAIESWKTLREQYQANSKPALSSTIETAEVLTGLWSNPPRLLPNAEEQLQKHLEGWFRYQALSRLYQLQQRTDALASLQVAEQEIAQQAFTKLLLANGIQSIGGFIGIGLLIFVVGQRLLKGKQSLWAKNQDIPWSTPWDWEIILQVLVGGFFFFGQILVGRIFLPILFAILRINPADADVRMQAFYILLSYLLLAAGGIGILYISVRPYFVATSSEEKPETILSPEQRQLEGWFRFNWGGNWLGWGVGGYLIALPLVVIVSLINQQLWQGQGGSNPILPIALEGRDPIAIALFVITASIAAPIFEEIIFRGFLLPSLTRYVPVWGAIFLSALIFSIAHLSLSEILPLATLGTVLGFVYTRSRNLLAPILLHSLWNGTTLFSLFLLGSGGS